MSTDESVPKKSSEGPGPAVDPSSHDDEFAREAMRPSKGVIAEFVDFLAHNKKWWLLPIVIALLLVGLLIVLGGTSLAPFIYPLF